MTQVLCRRNFYSRGGVTIRRVDHMPLISSLTRMPVVSKRCVAIATLQVAVTLISACAASPPKSPEQAQADDLIAERISLALNADPTYFYRHVDVRVDGGVAHLSGYIWSTEELYRAKQIAAGVLGVKRVVNEMELERGGNRGGGHSGSG